MVKYTFHYALRGEHEEAIAQRKRQRLAAPVAGAGKV